MKSEGNKGQFHLVNSAVTITSGISQTFKDAYTAFNNQDWPTLSTLLDKDVIVYNISQDNAAVGYGAAQIYFQNIFKTTHDKFQPIGTIGNGIVPWPSVYPVRLTGKANWTDATGTKPISFDFQFDGISFLLTAMWASH